MPKRIVIIAGEPSGDLHASNLVREIRLLRDDIEFFGLGGSLMKKAGVEIRYDVTGLALVGLFEVLKKIFMLGKIFKNILREIDEKGPDLAVLVDYPGFNLRLAKELKRRGIPVVYYISPQLWAWDEGRIGIIKDAVSKMVVLFGFEEEFYKRHGVSAECAGHPLAETAKPSLHKDEVIKKYGLDPLKTTIAILPGSRRTEVVNLLPVMLDAAGLVLRKMPKIQILVARFPGVEEAVYEKEIKKRAFGVKLITADTYNVLNASDFAIVASGTATLETALIGTPMVIAYKGSFMNWLAFKAVVKIKDIGLVNIIAGRKVVPEFLQFDARADKLSKKVIELLSSPGETAKMKNAFSDIRASIGAPGASKRAARAVLACLK